MAFWSNSDSQMTATASVESSSLLHKYFNTVVQVNQRDKKVVVSDVVENVKQLLRGCNDQDRRVAREPRCVGSSWQGLKTKDPFEYDINVFFGIKDVTFGGGGAPQRATFRLQDSETREIFWDDKPVKKSLKCYDITETNEPLPDIPVGHASIAFNGDEDDPNYKFAVQGHIVPFLVKRHFRELLENSHRTHKSNLRGSRNSLQKRDHGPANTLSTDFKVGDEVKTVTVDITPCIHVTNFPGDINWPRPGVQWPSADKVRKVKSMGVNLVAKKNYHWTISFSECEKELVDNIDFDRGERKKCYRVIKGINEDFWYIPMPHKKNPISTYALKNIWFWECERLPYAMSWSNALLDKRIYDMIDKILTYLDTGELPHYFNPQINMLQGSNRRELGDLAEQINRFRINDQNMLQNRIKKYGRTY